MGERFDAVVTGASEKGTLVRVVSPPIEGMLVGSTGTVGTHSGPDVGDRLRVRLVRADVERGYIDFTAG